jgi:hypothetical protein
MKADGPVRIRETHSPFAGGPAIFLAFVCWTDYRCPHCNGRFRIDFWPDNVRLGSGERTCDKCGKVFDDGAREWPELKLGRKLRYFLPPGVIAIVVSCLLCGIGALLVAPADQVNWEIGFLVVGVSLAPTLLWCLARTLFVRRSIYRYQNDPNSMKPRLETARD